MESILDSISASRPLNQLFSKKIISLNKLYLVKCEELGMWSRAVINDFLFTDRKVSNSVSLLLICIFKCIYMFIFSLTYTLLTMATMV